MELVLSFLPPLLDSRDRTQVSRLSWQVASSLGCLAGPLSLRNGVAALGSLVLDTATLQQSFAGKAGRLEFFPP